MNRGVIRLLLTFMVNSQQPFPARNHLDGALFIGQFAFFVEGDDDTPTARMYIWKFLQWPFLPFLCFRIGYRIGYLYGQFVLWYR